MWYWIVMGILIFVAVLLIVIIIVALKKEKKTQDGYDYDEEYEDDLEDDDYEYEEEYRQPRRVKETADHREAPGQTTPFPAAGERGKELTSKGPVKKQWKLILENLDTWENLISFSMTISGSEEAGTVRNLRGSCRYRMIRECQNCTARSFGKRTSCI